MAEKKGYDLGGGVLGGGFDFLPSRVTSINE